MNKIVETEPKNKFGQKLDIPANRADFKLTLNAKIRS